MKWVRLEDNIVREIIPDAATAPSIAHWYGGAFASQCREAPNEVGQHWIYNPETESFAEPPPEPPSIEQQITDLQIAVVEQFEENLSLHEELTNTELAIVELFEMVIGGAKDG